MPLPICSFQIEAKILKALSKLTSPRESRRALNGVAVEINGGWIFAAATDGARLGVVRADGAESTGENGSIAIVPTGLIKLLPKPDRNGCVRVICNGETLSIEGETTISGKGIEGTYPNWRKIITTSELAPAGKMIVNGAFLTSFLEVATILNRRADGVVIERIKHDEAQDFAPLIIRLSGCPEFLGVLMPLRPGSPSKCIPEWALEATASQEAGQ